jgi:hypothetical protein
MTKHVLVFIHGMGDSEPQKGFKALWDGIASRYNDLGRGAFGERYERCDVAWHGVTAAPQHKVFEDAFSPMEESKSLLKPQATARTFVTHYLGDVVAYVDEADNGIRREVWRRMAPQLQDCERYSILAHSLGSVIAFDFLFHLFEEGVMFDAGGEPVDGGGPPVTKLKERFAGFYSMGSPIGLFMLRKSAYWRANPAGLFTRIKNPVPARAVWHNFGEDDDFIAYPLERLFANNPDNAGKEIRDIEVDNAALNPIAAHTGYWENQEVAKTIATSLAKQEGGP